MDAGIVEFRGKQVAVGAGNFRNFAIHSSLLSVNHLADFGQMRIFGNTKIQFEAPIFNQVKIRFVVVFQFAFVTVAGDENIAIGRKIYRSDVSFLSATAAGNDEIPELIHKAPP